jgi:hypothetical protein
MAMGLPRAEFENPAGKIAAGGGERSRSGVGTAPRETGFLDEVVVRNNQTDRERPVG